MQYTSSITNTTPVHCHINNLLFYFWKFSLIDIVLEKCLSWTLRILAIKALLSIRGLTVLDSISLVTSRTRERYQHHQRFSSREYAGITITIPWVTAIFCMKKETSLMLPMENSTVCHETQQICNITQEACAPQESQQQPRDEGLTPPA